MKEHFDCSKKSRVKSTFNPKNKDVTETNLSFLQERLLDINIPKDKFNNLSKEDREALHSLKNDNNVVIKGADKGSGVIMWGREDNSKEARKHLSDEEVSEAETSDYFFNKDPTFTDFICYQS